MKAKTKIPWCQSQTAASIMTGILDTAWVPYKVISEARRNSWFAARRRKQEFHAAFLATVNACKKPTLPVAVKLTRLYVPRMHEIDGHDNLKTAFKRCVDVIADWLIPGLPPGKADGDPRITWDYAQESDKVVGVRIEFT